MANLKLLLDLQVVDNKIDQLKSEEKNLPEARDLKEKEEILAKLQEDLEKESEGLKEVKRKQHKIEGELDLLGQKIEKEEERLYGGTISNPKELQAIQEEIASLNKKRDEQETLLLELLEEVESLTDNVNKLASELAEVREEVKIRQITLEKVTKEIEGALAAYVRHRSTVSEGIPADALKLYDQLRSEKQGLAVVSLEGSSCGGCHVELPAQDIDRMFAEEKIWRCPHCRRIVVVSR